MGWSLHPYVPCKAGVTEKGNVLQDKLQGTSGVCRRRCDTAALFVVADFVDRGSIHPCQAAALCTGPKAEGPSCAKLLG